jgi:cytochrome c oxidase assembly factor CtaG
MSAVLPPALLAAAACAGYLVAMRRAAVAWWRAGAFASGSAGAAVVAAWDPGSLTGHMVQHGLLTAVAAPLLVLGEPVTLGLRLASPAHRRAAYRALHALRHALGPWSGLALFVTVQWLAHWPAVLDRSEQHPALHAAVHVALMASAVVFFLPLLGRQPVPRRVPGGRAALHLMVAISLVDLVSVPYLATGRGEAAAAMLAAMSPLAVIAVALAWQSVLREERRMVQREAAS